MKKDIETAEDIKHLLDFFYAKVLTDKTIGYIFTDVAKIHLETHMPVLYSFWESVLLLKPGYKGNPMLAHINLHRKEPLTDAHFARWKQLFFETLDEFYEGPVVNLAKERVHAMEFLIKMKIADSDKAGFIQ